MSAVPSGGGGPLLGLDLGREGVLLAGNRLRLTGWAMSPSGIVSIAVRVGEREFTPSSGLPALASHGEPPDWPGASSSRFELALDCSDWRRGRHELEVVASDRGGATARVAAAVDVQPFAPPPYGDAEAAAEVAAGRAAMWCEQPAFFARPRGEAPLEVSGWAAAAAGIEEVLVTVDDAIRLRCPHGLPRPDLRSRFGAGFPAGAGFALRLDPSELPPGWHRLSVVAVSRDGEAVGVEELVECVDPADVEEEEKGAARDEAPEPRGSEPGADRAAAGRPAPEWWARYRWAAEQAAGARVLDVGCGRGEGTAALAARARAAVGVDAAAPLVAAAAAAHGESAEFRVADMRSLPFADAEFDLVTCFEALEQVDEPAAALDEMRRVLRPGGVLLVSCANAGVYPPGNPFHRAVLSSAELGSLLEARFANVAVHRQQPYFASLLGDDEALLHDDPGVPLRPEIAKLNGGRPGDELHAVAAAGDGRLPPPPSLVVVGDGFDPRAPKEELEAWVRAAEAAEADAADMRVHLRFAREGVRAAGERARQTDRVVARRLELEREIPPLESELAAERAQRASLEASRSWRLTAPLRRLRQLTRAKLHFR